jgi:hypothetical protein
MVVAAVCGHRRDPLRALARTSKGSISVCRQRACVWLGEGDPPQKQLPFPGRFPNTAEMANPTDGHLAGGPPLPSQPSSPLHGPPNRMADLCRIAGQHRPPSRACAGGMAYDAHSRPLAGFMWLRLPNPSRRTFKAFHAHARGIGIAFPTPTREWPTCARGSFQGTGIPMRSGGSAKFP